MVHGRRWSLACILVLVVCGGGCQRDGPTEINGIIVFDGQPLGKGNIAFMPADGQGPTAAAIVADGKYSVRIAPGNIRVPSPEPQRDDPSSPVRSTE
jgi:hypothetical protein